MGRFFNKENKEPVDSTAKWPKDLARLDSEITELERAPAALQAQIDKLALLVEDGDPNALEKTKRLEAELSTVDTTLRRKRTARHELAILLDAAKNEKWAREEKLLQDNWVKAFDKRTDLAKEVERTARPFVAAVAALQAHNEKLYASGRTTWPGFEAALVGPDDSYEHHHRCPTIDELKAEHARHLASFVTGARRDPSPPPLGLSQFIHQLLGHLCVEHGVRIPAPAYKATRWEDFPGLAATYKAINKNVRALIANAPIGSPPEAPKAAVAEPVIEAAPADSAEPNAHERAAKAAPIPDAIRADDPNNWPLSPRSWAELQEATASHETQVADGVTNLNPFTGGIDISEI